MFKPPSPEMAGQLLLQMDYSFDLVRTEYQERMSSLSDVQREALDLLIESADLGNVDAAFMLAEMNMYGNYTFPTNGSLALQYYHRVVELEPNATAYFNLGFIYATGLFGEVELNQAKANMYYEFAFEQGDLRAAMVLGYRYFYGVSMPEECDKAKFYYRIVADEMKKIWDQGPLGGPHLDSFNIRVSDFQDGVYGKGVGDVKTSLKRRSDRYDHILHTDTLTVDEYSIYDQIYYRAITNYEGSYTRSRNFAKAYNNAMKGYTEGLTELRRLQDYEKYYVARCAYLLGHMSMRGETGGTAPDYDKALEYLKKSLEIFPKLIDPKIDLGLIYSKGPESLRDPALAKSYFNSIQLYQSSPSNFTYGPLGQAFGVGETQYYTGIEQYYHYAEIFEHKQKEFNCNDVVNYLKHFVEYFDPILTSLNWAHHELGSDRPSNALIGYAMAAEMGFEEAQASAAFLMYQPPGLLELPPVIPKERREMAKVYITRSSWQNNWDSTVLLGDMYFAEGEYEKAVSCYAGVDLKSAQASFNMGWMYEMGLGVEKDFNLAKRYYDLSMANHAKAYLPVQISLVRLRFKRLINKVFGSENMSDETAPEPRTWADWLNLYQKVRGKTQIPSDYEIGVERNLSPEMTEPQENLIDLTEEFVIILFFGGAFLMFWVVYMLQQRQIRRRNAEARGDQDAPQPQPEIQIRFGFVAI
ncbi:ERAD-associated E3 ubiquitin-protein ligase component HRD3 [Cyberlindnera fabianii]|uniref:ERAD-associated E3 ubiquitin-protein ligase component HRD3 n=1 Tax=Cyberlindnera fabianii TaxID=36022 RepID=A0A1V2L225_CYBFA|nr:ERAD-associated E3 ubiquitin-protein ligase component HRD3 [Cyberlindnera fabianii]